MANITFKGNPVTTAGTLPEVGTKAPNFTLTGVNLANVQLSDYAGKKVVLNIFPSIDTGTCAASVRRFNQEAQSLDDTVVLCISKDLPFAHKRFCGAEGLDNVISLSEFKDSSFSNAYKVRTENGPLEGLHSRCIVVIDENGMIKHTEQVAETIEEPNYDNALAALK